MPELLPLLARQPIFNFQMPVVTYELLYRSSDMNKATFNDGHRDSSQIILNTYGNLSMAAVVGPHQAYLNFTRALLRTPPPFDRRQLVIDVLENKEVDADMFDSVKNLKKQGY